MTQSNSQLSAYDVEQEIGRGDLTIIYRARRKSDGLPVTVKVLAPQFVDDPYLVRRFVEAGQRAARLDHPKRASAKTSSISYVSGLRTRVWPTG